MTPERWRQVERVLHAALESAPAERAGLLDRECAGDPGLRAEVESLLAAQPAEGFLNSNAFEDAAALLDDSEPGSLVGRNVGHYAVERQIGSGGMGEVYLAEDARLGRKVALKLLDRGLAGDAVSRARFLREARLASALDHPNVCTIHEVGEAEGRPFIAMQHVEGETLRQLLAGRPLKLDSLLSVALQVADALAAMHGRGVIHRDIKAGNIIVTPEGQAKVLDFGLAKLLERAEGRDESHLTMAGQVMGTPASMSPEQARGERVDHRGDIFSFGCVLYEMATGQIPFKGKTRAEVIGALLHKAHTPAAELNREIPARLSAVIDRALAKEPADRYQSAREMIADLRQVVAEAGGLDHLFSSSEVPRGVLPLVPPRGRGLLASLGLRGRTAAAVSAAFVLALAVLALAIYFARRAQPQSGAPIKSIAVLPFKPLGAGVRDEVLELGMADTLIARLGNIREVAVRPVSAVHKYAGLEQDAVAAGREQRVDAVLEGHIQKAGEKVRVSVRLLRVADGEQLWADRFGAEMTDIFAVQDSISERVAAALAVRLASSERERLTKHHTKNPEAYRLYLLGRYHLSRLTDDGFLKGRDYFQQAVDLDPDYAPAYAGLADAYQMLSSYNALAPGDGFPKAKEAATQALRLDEGLAEAHAALGTVKLLHDWDFEGAEREYRRAVEISPSYADARLAYGYYLSAMGRFEEAHAEMRRAQELDPLSLAKIVGAGDVLYQQRQHDRALEQYRRALEMDPNSGITHWALGNVYVQKGMYEEAVAEYQKAIPLSGDSPDELASLGYVYALSGKRREAQAVIEELEERSKRRYISPTVIAFIHAGLGERDESFARLERAYDGRDFILVLLKVEPLFDRLRPDPRFAELVRRVGLPQ
jgi:TolB-like protein/tetratricopeptide (TPR) repeat protein